MENKSSVNPSDFWNVPPVKAFASGITTSRGKKLEVKWPLVSLPSTKYYISLYFQDNRSPSPFSWRVFSVSVNGMNFYTDLNVTHKGIMVYSAKWPLSGQTVITMTPNSNSPVGPLINAAEILQIFPLGGRTNTRDGNPQQLFYHSILTIRLCIACFFQSSICFDIYHSDGNGGFSKKNRSPAI